MAGRLNTPVPDTLTRAELKHWGGGQLQADVVSLIDGCTMVGRGHDELHTFLDEFIPVVNAMVAEGNYQDVSRIVKHLDVFFQKLE